MTGVLRSCGTCLEMEGTWDRDSTMVSVTSVMKNLTDKLQKLPGWMSTFAGVAGVFPRGHWRHYNKHIDVKAGKMESHRLIRMAPCVRSSYDLLSRSSGRSGGDTRAAEATLVQKAPELLTALPSPLRTGLRMNAKKQVRRCGPQRWLC